MSEEMKNDARHAMHTLSSRAAGRNLIFGKFGKYVNAIKIAYLASSQKEKGKCDIASMLETFQASDEIRFTCLSDIPVGGFSEDDATTTSLSGGKTITVSLSKKENNKIIRENVEDSKALAPIEPIAKEERIARNMPSKDILFISIAWIVLPVFRFFLLCPEVIWCDVTSHSNNKGFHLLTFSCRTSIDKQVVFMWI
jgi:hypothetical protein